MGVTLTVTLQNDKGQRIEEKLLRFEGRAAAEEQLKQLVVSGPNIIAHANKQITIVNEGGEQIGFPLRHYLSHDLKNS